MVRTLKRSWRLVEHTESIRPSCFHCADPTESQNNCHQKEDWRPGHQSKDDSVSRLPPDYEEKVTNFNRFTQTKIAENSIGPADIINMDKVPLTFDMPLIRTVNKKDESSVNWKQQMRFLSCTASEHKLPPMVIFKWMATPKEKLLKEIVVKVNKKGWMIESLMK